MRKPETAESWAEAARAGPVAAAAGRDGGSGETATRSTI